MFQELSHKWLSRIKMALKALRCYRAHVHGWDAVYHLMPLEIEFRFLVSI